MEGVKGKKKGTSIILSTAKINKFLKNAQKRHSLKVSVFINTIKVSTFHGYTREGNGTGAFYFIS